MFTSELEYYRLRAREERERAATSPNPIVAEVHRALADKYEALAGQPEIRAALSRLWRSRESALQGHPELVAGAAPQNLATLSTPHVPTGVAEDAAPFNDDSAA